MSNSAGRELLAILHGKAGLQAPALLPLSQYHTHHRNLPPYPQQQQQQARDNHGYFHHQDQYAQHYVQGLPPQPFYQNKEQQPFFQVYQGFDVNFNRPTRRYTRETILACADSEYCRRMPRRLDLALEELPMIRRKRLSDFNPYYFDPASGYLLGPTQVWDSELQQWVVMAQK